MGSELGGQVNRNPIEFPGEFAVKWFGLHTSMLFSVFRVGHADLRPVHVHCRARRSLVVVVVRTRCIIAIALRLASIKSALHAGKWCQSVRLTQRLYSDAHEPLRVQIQTGASGPQ